MQKKAGSLLDLRKCKGKKFEKYDSYKRFTHIIIYKEYYKIGLKC